MHLPTTLFVDLQTLYPKHWIEGTVLNQVVQWYIQQTRDPLLDGVFRGNPNWNWIVPFLYLEGVFQAPCFVLGAYGLWKSEIGS
jgi:hypothetical protein